MLLMTWHKTVCNPENVSIRFFRWIWSNSSWKSSLRPHLRRCSSVEERLIKYSCYLTSHFFYVGMNIYISECIISIFYAFVGTLPCLYEFISLNNSGCRQVFSVVLSLENSLQHVSLQGPRTLRVETNNQEINEIENRQGGDIVQKSKGWLGCLTLLWLQYWTEGKVKAWCKDCWLSNRDSKV